MPMACADEFGTGDLQDRLKAFCEEQGLEMLRFWFFPPNGGLYQSCNIAAYEGKGALGSV